MKIKRISEYIGKLRTKKMSTYIQYNIICFCTCMQTFSCKLFVKICKKLLKLRRKVSTRRKRTYLCTCLNFTMHMCFFHNHVNH